jgi:hypothetical protein
MAPPHSRGRRLQVGFTSLGETLQPNPLAVLPGAAGGARAAHVVTLGPIGIARHLEQTLPALDEGDQAVAERKLRGETDQHGTSQCALPRTDAKGTAKTS